ncbi:MAG: sulfotransferase [Proteobacteria bacterium]|nr:sulfotransferase [Pseudomonadota bacterium]
MRHRNAAVHALVEGRIDAAAEALTEAMNRAPVQPELLRLQALVDLRCGRTEQGIGLLLQARAMRPEDPLIHDALGTAYEAVSDHMRARQSLFSACRLEPDNPGFWFNYANRLYEVGDNVGAMHAVDRVLKLDPRNTQGRGLFATLMMASGRNDQALDMYRSIVRDDPFRAGIVWWWLATMKPLPLSISDIDVMQRIFLDRSVLPKDRVPTGFALALTLENRGRIEEAFHVMQMAHALAREISPPYDLKRASTHQDDILAQFETRPAEAPNAQGREVLFVVSMPRSGSTLTEQILATHSQVDGGGELSDFLQVVTDESDREKMTFPDWVHSHSPEKWRLLGQRYLARTRRFRARKPRFTDKSLGNWLLTGAILSALPEARVIVVRRDPLETCLACYRYMITHAYTHSFADLAAVWRNFDRGVRFWQERYPDRVYVQHYEKLVANPEGQIRKLLEFCDLAFEEACLTFHETERFVTTPSATQVREPIRKDTARARKYGALLDPLRAELGLPPFTA